MRRKFWLFTLALFIGVRVVLSYVSTCGECNNTFVNVDGDNMTGNLFSTGFYGHETLNIQIDFEEGTVGSCPEYWDNCQQPGWGVNESAGTELTSKVLQFMSAGGDGLKQMKWEDDIANTSPVINFSYDLEVTSYTSDIYMGGMVITQLCQEPTFCSDRPLIDWYISTGAGTYALVHFYDFDGQIYDIVTQTLAYDTAYHVKMVVDYDNNCTEYWIDGEQVGDCLQFAYTVDEDYENTMGALMFYTLNPAQPIQWLMDNLEFEFKTPIYNITETNATRYNPYYEPLQQGGGAYTLYYDSQEETFCFYNSTGHINCLDHTPKWVVGGDH